MSEQIRVDAIETDGPARYAHIVSEYAERIRSLQPVRPILVSRNSKGVVRLVDGNHRLAAWKQVGAVAVECFVFSVH